MSLLNPHKELKHRSVGFWPQEPLQVSITAIFHDLHVAFIAPSQFICATLLTAMDTERISSLLATKVI